MTAFGRGTHSTATENWTVEIRSVNHRFADINVKLPRKIAALEERIKKSIADYYSRGRVDAFIDRVEKPGSLAQLAPNLPFARDYFNCLLTIKNELGLSGAPELAMFAARPEIVAAPEEQENDIEEIWSRLRTALDAALGHAAMMRENEGLFLRHDIAARLAAFAATLSVIEAVKTELLEKRKAALKERLERLLEGMPIDPMRLAQEGAILADRADITEELVRLGSHLAQFRSFLDLEEPIGRRLDFLTQEMLRELNTMGAKINDAGVAHQIVELKNELEKIREQVQNIE